MKKYNYKRFLLWGFIFLLSTALEAQEIVARLDLGRRDPKPEFYEYSSADGGLVTFGPSSISSSRSYSLVKYGADLREDWTIKVLDQNGRKTIDFMAVVGGYTLIFVSETNPKDGLIKSYYYSYSAEGEALAEKELLSVYPDAKEQKVGLQFVLSPNKKKLLCFKNLQNRRENEQLLYYIFDDEGDYVQNGELNLKYPDNRFSVRSLRISNRGNIFVLGKFYLNTRVREADDFTYTIFRHDLETEEVNEFQINLDDRYITDLAFRLDRDENIYVAGFYSNRSTDRIAGTVLQKISPFGELLLTSAEAFDAEFLQYYLSRGQINRGSELRNFYLDPTDGIILRSDGGVLLTAEKFYITYVSYRDMYGHWIDREQYHYEDVILTSVAADGSIEWHAIVDKNQVSENPANLSFFNAISAAGSHIFYEYNPQRQGINIYYNTVDIDGKVSDRKPLLPDYRFGNQFYPRYCEQVSNDEALMVYMQSRGRTLSVVRVRLE
ncbi:MAG: hypothetical protein AAF927_22115 [Bacteroidota bacterium]